MARCSVWKGEFNGPDSLKDSYYTSPTDYLILPLRPSPGEPLHAGSRSSVYARTDGL